MDEELAERRRLIRLMRRLNSELDQLGHVFAKKHALHPTNVRAIFLIMESGLAGTPITPGDLARRLGLTTAAVSSLLDRLEQADHLVRRPVPGDRRRVHLEVAPEAMTLAAGFFHPLNARLTAAMEDYSPQDMAAIERFLTDMTREVSGYREANS
ncbi:MarR family winged helix-turn-helix transcriptional regulator [Actinocorallia populi]|uniref:MarR family winged helix-turn-helix transcriptional regulator n=1 Tax=Actinocorallia populi TaxID=2079200 RepID=UPI0013005A16|nr:MarR family transcriptional regulator [Actinocorallia populi]